MGLPYKHNVTSPAVPLFFSRPDLHPPILEVQAHDLLQTASGYVFLAPSYTTQSGPYIYDNEGNLIWSGFGISGPSNAYGLHVCAYQGSPHLCFFAGNQLTGYASGHGVIMNRNYRTIATVNAVGIGMPSDMHEFKLTPGGKTALMTIYQPRQYDLSEYGVLGLGWIMEGIFQEVDIASNTLIFEWRSLDHVGPSMSFLNLSSSKEGTTPTTPWDYFHINSVEKNNEGDYLVSSRHTHCIYKVSGQNGSILWELQGKNSTFDVFDFDFSWQHDTRWLYEDGESSIISLFDNARTQEVINTPFSSGKIITIHHTNKTTTLNAQVQSPLSSTGLISAMSQGSIQVLENKNLLLGWGAESHVSEHLPNGAVVWHVTWEKQQSPNYRAFKATWLGDPNFTYPAIWSYARTNSSRTIVYVSWNGVTEIRAWNIYAGKSREQPLVRVVAGEAKRGFETAVWLDGYWPWAVAEAVGEHGKGLTNSSIVRTLVPSAAVAENCGETHCLDVGMLIGSEGGLGGWRWKLIGSVDNIMIGWVFGCLIVVIAIVVLARKLLKRGLTSASAYYLRVESNLDDD